MTWTRLDCSGVDNPGGTFAVMGRERLDGSPVTLAVNATLEQAARMVDEFAAGSLPADHLGEVVVVKAYEMHRGNAVIYDGIRRA